MTHKEIYEILRARYNLDYIASCAGVDTFTLSLWAFNDLIPDGLFNELLELINNPVTLTKVEKSNLPTIEIFEVNPDDVCSLLNGLKSAGVNQQKVAQHLGVTPRTVSKWFNRESKPSVDNYKRLKEFCESGEYRKPPVPHSQDVRDMIFSLERFGFQIIQIAKHVGVSQFAVSAWKTGFSRPNPKNLYSLKSLYEGVINAIRPAS
jgi:DNA-binding transcriptional regulator YiaG